MQKDCVAVCVVRFAVTDPVPLQAEWVINRVDTQKVAFSLTRNTPSHTDPLSQQKCLLLCGGAPLYTRSVHTCRDVSVGIGSGKPK